MNATLSFLGAAGTVTGSRYLLEVGEERYLIDCGLFQGFKQLRLRNWTPIPIPPESIDAVVLTHAHLDHSGYVPLLCRNGFAGPVVCTAATSDLSALLLKDSGFLQEKEAEFANRHHYSKHKPALPLYTVADADASLEQFSPVRFDAEISLSPNVTCRFLNAGHIPGAAIVEVNVNGCKVVFSGDLGRPNSVTMFDPAVVKAADYLVVESTYGNRVHEARDPEDALAEVINRTVARGGTVLVPAFAVGRTQTLLFHLWRLRTRKRIPDIPIFLDSPMAIDASDLFIRHHDVHKLTADEAHAACAVARYTRDVEESKALNANAMPKIIVSASGMATGGRVLHHLENCAPDPRNTILFTGFQAGGTRGASLVGGADSVKIHGRYVPVRASISNLEMLSAHADCNEIVSWLRQFEQAPRMTFVTHGEPAQADALRHRIEEELGWACSVPDFRESVTL